WLNQPKRSRNETSCGKGKRVGGSLHKRRKRGGPRWSSEINEMGRQGVRGQESLRYSITLIRYRSQKLRSARGREDCVTRLFREQHFSFVVPNATHDRMSKQWGKIACGQCLQEILPAFEPISPLSFCRTRLIQHAASLEIG